MSHRRRAKEAGTTQMYHGGIWEQNPQLLGKFVDY